MVIFKIINNSLYSSLVKYTIQVRNTRRSEVRLSQVCPLEGDTPSQTTRSPVLGSRYGRQRASKWKKGGVSESGGGFEGA